MSSGRFCLRRVALAVLLLGTIAVAFVGGRSTRAARRAPNPVRLEAGIPIGAVASPGGAIAAAENFVSTGVTASVEPGQLRRWMTAIVDPTARDRFVVENPAPGSGPPPGARVTASVVAQRLVSYGAGSARVSMWVVASYWGGGAVPTQYWSLVHLSLRWSGDRWRIVSGEDDLPGPVPALIAGRVEDRSGEAWDQELSGMSGPYYGTAAGG